MYTILCATSYLLDLGTPSLNGQGSVSPNFPLLTLSSSARDCGARTVARLFPLLKVELIRLHYPIIIYIAIEYLLAEFFRYYVTITRESLTVD